MNGIIHKANYWWHALALLTAFLWGSTFVASKILLQAGLTPAEIMCLRFALSWVLLLPFCHSTIWSNWLDELTFLLLGLSGGSLYFLAENTAVKISSATSTVALLVCTTPIITALMNRFLHKNEHLSGRFMIGSVIALIGVSLVVLNGVFVLDDDPLVILLSLGASVLWGIYSLVIRRMEGRYSSAIITRKVFFYGIITMLPMCIAEHISGNSVLTLNTLLQPQVLVTLLFLSLIASLLCFLVWNIVISRIGIVTASNYLYFNPVVSLIVAYIVLSENITHLAILGCALTIMGVYLCNKKGKTLILHSKKKSHQ